MLPTALPAQVLDQLTIGVLILAPDTKVICWNAWLEEHSGRNTSDVVGRPFRALFPELEGTPILSAANNVLKLGQPRLLSQALNSRALPLFKLQRGTATKEPIEQAISLLPVRIDGARHCLIQVQDVTPTVRRERILKQKTQEAEAAKATERTFLTNMSHEIRTPLNGVLGVTELLMDTVLDDEQHKLVRTIDDSGKALLGVLNDILDFSKMDAGKLEVDPVATDVNLVLEQIVELMNPRIQANPNLKLELDVARLPYPLLLDSLRLRQILLNLVGNAVKFTEQGSVTLRCRYDLDRRKLLEIDVEDTGIGIANPQILFRQFKQADTSTARRFGGTGLGLAISKNLAELMGGELTARSIMGQGSIFALRLPAAPAILDDEHAPVTSARTSGTRSGIVLVVEDNKTNQLVARRFLEKFGLSVVIADNGQRALERLADSVFDLIFMDCQMPEMDGYEATRRIRQLPEPVCNIPIIAMTAHALQGERERCLEAGMDAYITKPITWKVVEKTVKDLCPQVSSWQGPKAIVG